LAEPALVGAVGRVLLADCGGGISDMAMDKEKDRAMTNSVEREWFVHNHGPSEGKGTACHEYRVNGRLLGECLLRSHEPEPQFVGGRWDCSCGWHAAKANAQIWWDHVAAALPASPDVVSVKKVLDRIVANDLAFGKPLTTEYPSRAMLRNDVKELAALLFGDSFHATDPDAKEAGE
jgi:hypothetical protein